MSGFGESNRQLHGPESMTSSCWKWWPTLLAMALRHYVDSVGPQGNWGEARQEVTAAFLDEDEQEFLRANVDKIVQNPSEESQK